MYIGKFIKNIENIFYKNNENLLLIKTPEGIFYNIDLSKVYQEVHSTTKNYGASGNNFIDSVFLITLEKLQEKLKNPNEKITLLDYGCGKNMIANIIGSYISKNRTTISMSLLNGRNVNDIFLEHENQIKEELKKFEEFAKLDNFLIKQIENYNNNVEVLRYDIGIKEYSKKIDEKADLIISLDVFEHVPAENFKEFLDNLYKSLKNDGKIIANISNRDAVNYCRLNKKILTKPINQKSLNEKQKLSAKQTEIVNDNLLMSLHVNIHDQIYWKKILQDWDILLSSDATASFAIFDTEGKLVDKNVKIYLYKDFIDNGMVDLIQIPTERNSRYEKDPILHDRVIDIQLTKNICILNWLKILKKDISSLEDLNNEKAINDFIDKETKKVMQFLYVFYSIKNLDVDYDTDFYITPTLDEQKILDAREKIRAIEYEVKSKNPNSTNKELIDVFYKKIEEIYSELLK